MRAAFAVAEPTSTALRALNYTPAIESFRRKAGTRQCSPLGKLVTDIGKAYGSVFTRLDCQPAYGVELVSQGDMFASEPAGRVIRRDSMPHPENHRIKKWQILIAGAGTLGQTEIFGRSIIADGRLENKYVGPHAIALTFEEPGSADNLTTYAFLQTGVGVSMLRSACYGTKVLGIRHDVLASLPIPRFSNECQSKVSSLVKEAVDSREKFVLELAQARGVIDERPEVQQALAMCLDSQPRCLSWQGEMLTLNAWNYASMGGAITLLREAWPTRFKDVVRENGVFLGPRLARQPCVPPHGIDFYSQRDVFMMKPIPRRIVRPPVEDQSLFVPQDAILLAANGQLKEGNLFGRAELAAFGSFNSAITGHIMRVLPKARLGHSLFAFLSTRLGLRLLRSTAIGSSVPTMHVGLLENLPVPELDLSEAALVERHLVAAIKARITATAAESEAIELVNSEVQEWLN